MQEEEEGGGGGWGPCLATHPASWCPNGSVKRNRRQSYLLSIFIFKICFKSIYFFTSISVFYFASSFLKTFCLEVLKIAQNIRQTIKIHVFLIFCSIRIWLKSTWKINFNFKLFRSHPQSCCHLFHEIHKKKRQKMPKTFLYQKLPIFDV